MGAASAGLVLLAGFVVLHPRLDADAARQPHVSAGEARSPRIRHVFVVNLENKGYLATWGPSSVAPYLAQTLRAKGVLLSSYYGTAHHSLGNYVAQISGQGPDQAIQKDCSTYSRFVQSGPVVRPAQVVGDGCVYPDRVDTIAGQLTRAGLSWRGYMEDMGSPCQHSRLGAPEHWRAATPTEQYASRHNPFVYFRSITSHPAYCRAHVTALSALRHDLKRVSTTRSLSYITPDLCHDAHDVTCADGGPGGLTAANVWLRHWIPKILSSPAFRESGMLVITADESGGGTEGSTACCGEGPGPNAAQPGITGPGGGRIGALVIAPGHVTPGSTSTRPYNHYSLLASLEDVFGLKRLGYARTVTHVFGHDVYDAS